MLFASRALIVRRSCVLRTLGQGGGINKRGMAGGFPSSMAVKKNIYMEEWNGKREITEQTFQVDYADVPTFIIVCLLMPYGIYTWSRSEFLNGDDTRYHDIF